ncbi:MAG: hypothetical protein ABI680_15125 [Chthoniobacteraceae bacterium]
MSDFAQHGLIATFQRLNTKHLGIIEQELIALSEKRPIGLVLPCHERDLERPAFTRILRQISRAEFLSEVVVSINGAEASKADQERAFQRIFNEIPSLGLHFLWQRGMGGKGENAAAAIADLTAAKHCRIIAFQDCDVASFRRVDLARLCYPVAQPDLGYRVAKAYYSRVTDRLYGRVSRLFFTPLLQAILRVAGHHPLVDFLLSFRYPLAGEIAIDAELAAELPPASGYALELSQLCEIFRRVDPRQVCQVDGGSGYDHRHQPADTALAGMAAQLADELFRQLALEGLTDLRMGIASAYRREAAHALHRSAALARLNALPFDSAAEASIVDIFAGRL